jgi:geranylgeranyl transferase type-2 subunit alpha
MYHGRKRSQRRELTPEELEVANKKLEKVEKINKAFLEKRIKKEYTEKTLDMTQKLAILSPDFDTVWNYRREIITELNNPRNPEEKYKFYITELLGLVKLMKENPKSYTLWGHRQWVILEGLKIEKFMSEEKLKEV